MRTLLWSQGVGLALCASLGSSSFAQAVSPRRETQVVDEFMIDDGDDLDAVKENGEGELADVLVEPKAQPLTARRARHSRGITLAVGSTKPWQRATLAFYSAFDEWTTVGFFVGGGGSFEKGNLGLKFFDLSVQSRGFGVQGQRWFKDAEHFGLEATFGYVAWDGKLTPRGQVEEEGVSSDVLSTGIQGTGLFGGLSLLYSWIWDNRVTFDWTILGVQKSLVLKLDQSQPSPAAGSAVRSGLTSPEFFGLTGVAVGYRF